LKFGHLTWKYLHLLVYHLATREVQAQLHQLTKLNAISNNIIKIYSAKSSLGTSSFSHGYQKLAPCWSSKPAILAVLTARKLTLSFEGFPPWWSSIAQRWYTLSAPHTSSPNSEAPIGFSPHKVPNQDDYSSCSSSLF
jgi:hypothetical protein